MLAAVVAQPQPQAKQALPPAEVVKLRERFEEATKALRQGRRGGHSLYDLPWYVIIGAPGSGKTTALLNSGLKFPLEQRVGKGALRGVGGTRNCDWWFTDEAVFLDTAGRYTTQDSDPASDSVGWGEFLALLRKHRARRPVNGVILTVSAHDLLLLDAAGREAHIDAARSRLDELNRGLRIQLPVYLMVTKCDLVEGFAEYFESLTAEGRAQVWGVTFPYEESLANQGPEVFPAEFDALMTRLNERVFERVEEARQTRRRTKVFAFPQQMATLRGALTDWVTDVFDASDFRGKVFLRGVYFTSGTQEGTPIDRLLGSIGRGFGASDAVMRPAGPGKAYFVENLLKEVMIGESGLAGVNRRLELRNASALLGVYIATGVIAAAGVAALSVSYSANREYLDQAAADIAALERTNAVTSASPLDQVARRLDAIRAVVESSERYRASTSWGLRWGLYQGRSIGNAAQDAYVRELDSTLLPRIASQIKVRLTQYATDPQKLFDYLKGYLMLGDPRNRLDKEHLQMLADREWNQAARALRRGRRCHSTSRCCWTMVPRFDRSRSTARWWRRPRSSGRLLPMAKILYDGLKRTYAADSSQGLRVDQLAGLDVERVFKRRSGVAMSTPLPRLYTRDVFRRITQEGRAELVAQLAKDAWVWGESTTGSPRECGNAGLGSDPRVRAGLHPRLGCAARRPAVRVVPDRPAGERRAAHPDGADLTPARSPEGRRRPHHARRERPGRTGPEGCDRRDAAEGDRQCRGHTQADAGGGRRLVGRTRQAGDRAFPVGATALGRRSRQDAARCHPADPHADPAAARQARPRCSRRESRADLVQPVVPRPDAVAPAADRGLAAWPADADVRDQRHVREGDRRRRDEAD